MSNLFTVFCQMGWFNQQLTSYPHNASMFLEVRNHLWVFINCLIENPAFDSQTKESLERDIFFGWAKVGRCFEERDLHSRKTNMRLEKQQFEDVSPIKKWWFSIVMLVYWRVWRRINSKFKGESDISDSDQYFYVPGIRWMMNQTFLGKWLEITKHPF